MTIKSNERTRCLWQLAQGWTADFITGLEAGMTSVDAGKGMIEAILKNPASRGVVAKALGNIAFGDIKIRSLELIYAQDWLGGSALLEGMQEGVEYGIERHLGEVQV